MAVIRQLPVHDAKDRGIGDGGGAGQDVVGDCAFTFAGGEGEAGSYSRVWLASGEERVGVGERREMEVPDGVAVKPAQVPVVYHVPPLMMQPFVRPPLVTGRVPRPEKGTPGVDVAVGEGGAPVAVERVVGAGGVEVLGSLGRYLMPSAGQLDLEPSETEGLAGFKRKGFAGYTWIRGDEFPGLETPPYVVEIPDLVEFAVPALDRHVHIPRLGERFLNLLGRIRHRGGREDFSGGKEGVGI